MYLLGLYKFKCFVYPDSLSCVSHSIDICTVVIKNIRNMYFVSTNQIADILCFNDKQLLSHGAESNMGNIFRVCHILKK